MEDVFERVWGTSTKEHFAKRHYESVKKDDVILEIVRGLRLLKRYGVCTNIRQVRKEKIIPSGVCRGQRIPSFSSTKKTQNYSKYCKDCQVYFWNTRQLCKICRATLELQNKYQNHSSDHKKCQTPFQKKSKMPEPNTENSTGHPLAAKRKMISNGSENASKKRKMNPPKNLKSPTLTPKHLPKNYLICRKNVSAVIQ